MEMKKAVKCILYGIIGFIVLDLVAAAFLVVAGPHILKAMATEEIEKTITTEYGDVLTIEAEMDSFFKPVDIKVQVNGKELRNSSGGAWITAPFSSPELCRESADIEESVEEKNIRAYKFNWGTVYTANGGRTWKYVTRDNYETEKEFKKIYDLINTEAKA